MADDEPERPLLTEMAEKLRQARSTSFTDRPEPAAADPPSTRAPAARPVEPSAPDPLQVALRIDSLERRLFELRAALEDAVAPASAAGAAGFHPAPDDAAAWIAFAAAAMTAYDGRDASGGRRGSAARRVPDATCARRRPQRRPVVS